MPVPEGARTLERLLRRIHALGGQLLSMDAYERWGGGADPAMNEMLARGGEVRDAHTSGLAELDTLLARLRVEDAGAVAYWAEAHERLLARVVETTSDDTARFVAEQERRAWRALRDEGGPVVRENVFYVHVDPELHSALFGELPAETLTSA